MQSNDPARRAPVALGYKWVRTASRPDDPEPRHAVAIEDFCRRKGWHLVEVQQDIESRQRKGPPQPALAHAIASLRDGDASCLVVAELSDLCSSVAELGAILNAVQLAQARLVSLDPPFDTGTPVGNAVGRALTVVSGWERARRAHMTAGARSKRTQGTEVPRAIRRRIVAMRRGGFTLQAIADQLNQEGVPTVRGGRMWRPSSVQATLGYKRPQPWTQPEAEGSEG